MAEITYYFNSKSTSVWTDSEYMIDGNVTYHAYTTSTGDTEILDGNNCHGTNLGTITKVEINLWADGDGDDRIDVTPVFGGVDDGDVHEIVPPILIGPTAYHDITTDTNAPSPWSWADIQNLDCKVTYTRVGKGNEVRCGMVSIRVTFTTAAKSLIGKSLISPDIIKKAIIR